MCLKVLEMSSTVNYFTAIT